MSVLYVDEMDIDLGEIIHVRCKVKPKCDQDLPFVISAAKYELIYGDSIEASGDCVINGHELDIMISPKFVGPYRLRYIYNVADETWIDNIRVRVR